MNEEPRPYSGGLTHAEYVAERDRIRAEDAERITLLKSMGLDQFGRPTCPDCGQTKDSPITWSFCTRCTDRRLA